MTKKIIILISISALLIIFFAFFYKGTVSIRPSATPVKIAINKNNYENKDSMSVRLTPGNHKIKIEKEGYKTYETTIKVNFLEKKELSPVLELTEESKDKKEIEKVSKDFTEAWYTYDSQTSKEYLEKIKPFMTKDFYDGAFYINTNRPQDFKGQVPLRTAVSSVKINSYSSDKAETGVTRSSVEPTTNKSYQKEIALNLIKENNKWLINYLTPILK